jgi:hypothetical protein
MYEDSGVRDMNFLLSEVQGFKFSQLIFFGKIYDDPVPLAT